ncbi:MAG: hypothetical protein JSR15_10330, partial [Proteobacteria bacterium]|nr:hypothetical protein [Pseudomonadota bacterium]
MNPLSAVGGDAAAAPQRALVLIAHGASARVRLPDGAVVLARIARRGLQCVCG